MICRICNSTDFSFVLDLGKQPWGNHFLKKDELGTEPFYPLRMVFCHRCHTAQIDYTIKKEKIFSNHTYLSGTTKTLSNFFESVAQRVDQRFFANQNKKNVLDIGSNDGTQLKMYKKLGYDVLGVESAKNIAEIAQIAGIPTVNEIYNRETAIRIGKQFDVINASGVFFHLEELHSVTDAIRHQLKKDGVFIVQFIYMKTMMDHTAFDQIYHEHLLYYTLETLDRLLCQYGLVLFDAELESIHGGSVVGYVTHKGVREPTDRLKALKQQEETSKCNEFDSYLKFAKDVELLKIKNLAFFENNKKSRIFGLGAPVKGNTLLNYFGLTKNHLECLVEKNALRKGLFSPGAHLPILMEDEAEIPDIYYVLAWNFKNEILLNNQELINRGVKLYFPVNV